MLYKMERKLGKYAIPHLINYFLIGYGIGYVLLLVSRLVGFNIISYLTLEPYYIIHNLQLWRLITWVIMPPSSGSGFMGIFFMLIMMFFYYQLGNTLEATWGTFKFNLYMFGGVLFTVIGAFIGYGIYTLISGSPEQVIGIGNYVSTNYLNMSIFLAFALCYPDMRVLFMFIIPIKMKWMAIIYVVITGYEVIVNLMNRNWIVCIMIVASLLNFGLFWLTTRNYQSSSAGRSSGGWNPFGAGSRSSGARRTKNGFHSNGQGAGFRPFNGTGASSDSTSQGSSNPSRSRNQPVARHKCAICGRTDITDPNMTFRFCSKCNGNYEYCQEHIFTHMHKK